MRLGKNSSMSRVVLRLVMLWFVSHRQPPQLKAYSAALEQSPVISRDVFVSKQRQCTPKFPIDDHTGLTRIRGSN